MTRVNVFLNGSADTSIETCCYFFNFKMPVVIPPYKELVASWDIHAPINTHFETKMQMDYLPIKRKVKYVLCQVMD